MLIIAVDGPSGGSQRQSDVSDTGATDTDPDNGSPSAGTGTGSGSGSGSGTGGTRAALVQIDIVQLIGIGIVIFAVGLVGAQAIGLEVVLSDSTLRILLIFGSIFVAGREAIRQVFGGGGQG